MSPPRWRTPRTAAPPRAVSRSSSTRGTWPTSSARATARASSRLLAETAPALPDFDGDRIARERDYLAGDAGLALEVFERARTRNIARLAALDAAALARRGTQEGVGEVTLGPRSPR